MRLTTSSCVRPKAAASATSCGRSRWPAFSAAWPERNVFAGGTHIGAGLQPGRQHDLAVFDADVFLHEHGVGAVGHRRAREDAHRLARLERRRRGRAGLDAAGHRKRLLFALRQIAARTA